MSTIKAIFKKLIDRSNPNRSVNGFVGDFEFYKQENRTCFKIPRIDIHSIAHICIKK